MASKPDDEVLDLLNTLIHELKAQMHRALRDDGDGTTPMEMRTLHFFGKNPDASPADMVLHSGRDKAQVTRTIGQLLEKALLERTPDPNDRRSYRLSLTEEGRRAYRHVQGHRKKLAARAVSDFDTHERAQLMQLLERMLSNVRKSD